MARACSSQGFAGKNLCAVLWRRDDVELFEYDLDSNPGAQSREELLAEFYADFHWVWLEYGKGNEDQMSEAEGQGTRDNKYWPGNAVLFKQFLRERIAAAGGGR